MKKLSVLSVLVIVVFVGFAGMVQAVDLSNFAITAETYSETENLEQIVQNEFGSDYRIADWTDIVAYHSDGGNAENFEDHFGSSAMVTYNGSHWYGSSRHYFYSISHRPGQTPHDGYLSHANIDNHEFDLGSWYGLNQHILVYLDTNIELIGVPPAPGLTVTTIGNTVTLSWSTVANAYGYTLFYAPPDISYIGDIDMGNQTSVSFDLWEGAAFYIAVKAYNTAGNSDYSNIEYFVCEEEVFFDDFKYDLISGGSESMLSTYDWQGKVYQAWRANVNGSNKITFSEYDTTGILELSQPGGTVGQGPGDANNPCLWTAQMKFLTGTYAARVLFDDAPYNNKDKVVQTFWTQCSHALEQSEEYSECDFEYLAYNTWGGPETPTLWMNTWEYNKPEFGIASPENRDAYSYHNSIGGEWIDIIFQVEAESRVSYFVYDLSGNLLDSHNVKDSKAWYTPESDMQIMLNIWIEKKTTTQSKYTMKVDWVYYNSDPNLSIGNIKNEIEYYRSNGVKRKDTTKQTANASTYQVYGANTYISGTEGYNPADYGYTLLGSASSTQSFSGSYDYFVIVTVPVNVAYVDTVQGSNGQYYATYTTGNTLNYTNVGGAPDNNAAAVGGEYQGESGGYILIDASNDSLSSVTVYIKQ